MTTENEAAPNDEMIAARAYDRYLQRGCEDGHDMDDWLAAEGELRAELVTPASGEASAGKRTARSAAAASRS